MPYPNILAGQRVTAALLNAGKMETVSNSAGAQTNATTTLTDATGLSFAVEANSTYRVWLMASYDAPTATDIKFAWTGPAGAVMQRNIADLSAATADNTASTTQHIRRGMGTAHVAGGPNGAANAFSVHEEDITLTTTNAGTATLQFAANAAGTATLQSDSRIYYQRVA